MAAPQLSVPDQIRQLEDARKLVLKDVQYYWKVIQVAVPLIGPSAQLEFRRWGSDFIAEAFASPALPLSQKETWSLSVLDTLKSLIEDPNQDVLVLRSVIQAAASIYPLAMRWMINNSYDANTWEQMTAIKTRIRDIWDTAPLTIRICCIKFAQRVVLAQTAHVNPDPRPGNPLDISRNMIPPNHEVLEVDHLEAEAHGFLDRMLNALEDETSDPLVVQATLNTLSVLIRLRPKTSNRILTALFKFNPLRLAKGHNLPTKTKVLVRSMEKTTRMLLYHLSKRDPQNPQINNINKYIERLLRSREEVLGDVSRKRVMAEQLPPIEAKRARTTPVSTQPQIEITPLKPGINSLADVFTLTANEGLKKFVVADNIPSAIAAKISIRTIANIDQDVFDRAIDGVRARFAEVYARAATSENPETALLDVEEDDDDYEPDYHTAEDTEQLMNKLDSSPSDERRDTQPPIMGAFSMPNFNLPAPPRLDSESAARAGQAAAVRVFETMKTLEDPSIKKSKGGFNRLAASSYDRDSWVTIISRLATRTTAGLETFSIKEEDQDVKLPSVNISDSIREMLYAYILEDFRKRIEVAVSWLSEEWYKEKVGRRFGTAEEAANTFANYEKWALRLIDAFFPYLHAQDKILMRFLSELPDLTAPMFTRVKTLCRDPSLVNLALTSLYYLVMFRPPIRDLALDAVQDIWEEYEDARPVAAKYLQRWRPGFVESKQQQNGEVGTANGTVMTD